MHNVLSEQVRERAEGPATLPFLGTIGLTATSAGLAAEHKLDRDHLTQVAEARRMLGVRKPVGKKPATPAAADDSGDEVAAAPAGSVPAKAGGKAKASGKRARSGSSSRGGGVETSPAADESEPDGVAASGSGVSGGGLGQATSKRISEADFAALKTTFNGQKLELSEKSACGYKYVAAVHKSQMLWEAVVRIRGKRFWSSRLRKNPKLCAYECALYFNRCAEPRPSTQAWRHDDKYKELNALVLELKDEPHDIASIAPDPLKKRKQRKRGGVAAGLAAAAAAVGSEDDNVSEEDYGDEEAGEAAVGDEGELTEAAATDDE